MGRAAAFEPRPSFWQLQPRTPILQPRACRTLLAGHDKTRRLQRVYRIGAPRFELGTFVPQTPLRLGCRVPPSVRKWPTCRRFPGSWNAQAASFREACFGRSGNDWATGPRPERPLASRPGTSYPQPGRCLSPERSLSASPASNAGARLEPARPGASCSRRRSLGRPSSTPRSARSASSAGMPRVPTMLAEPWRFTPIQGMVLSGASLSLLAGRRRRAAVAPRFP